MIDDIRFITDIKIIKTIDLQSIGHALNHFKIGIIRELDWGSIRWSQVRDEITAPAGVLPEDHREVQGKHNSRG